MQVVTDAEMRKFLTKQADLRCGEKHLSYVHPEAKTIRVDLQVKEPHQLVSLAREVAHLGYEEQDFANASLWITEWGVWDKQSEAIAFKTIERFRQSYGENRSLDSAPGHFFRHDEFVESVSCLVQPMLVGWDAYYVPWWAYGGLDYFVFASHDSFLDIEVRTTEMHGKALEVLKRFKWIRFEERPSQLPNPTPNG